MIDDNVIGAHLYGETLGHIRKVYDDGRFIFEHRWVYYNNKVFELDIDGNNNPTKYSYELLDSDFAISYTMTALRKYGAGLNHELINRITPKDAQRIVNDELVRSKQQI